MSSRQKLYYEFGGSGTQRILPRRMRRLTRQMTLDLHLYIISYWCLWGIYFQAFRAYPSIPRQISAISSVLRVISCCLDILESKLNDDVLYYSILSTCWCHDESYCLSNCMCLASRARLTHSLLYSQAAARHADFGPTHSCALPCVAVGPASISVFDPAGPTPTPNTKKSS